MSTFCKFSPIIKVNTLDFFFKIRENLYMDKKIYLDNAATTKPAQSVIEAMLPYYTEFWGNPSSIHYSGREAATAMNQAREVVADFLGSLTSEIIFTGGGTESDNLAIIGAARARSDKGKHIITSAIEHHAVSHPLEYLKKYEGYDITYLPVDGEGLVSPDNLREAIRPDTVLVTIMHANNEIGVIEPISELGAICKENGVLMHTDAVQSFGHIPTLVKDLNVDMLSLSAHKIYGPKGVGALYVKKGTKLHPIIHGGGHEKNRRSGTENVAGIVGLKAAVELAKAEMDTESIRQTRLRDKLLDGLTDIIPDSQVTGSRTHRLPNNASVIIKYIEGESMLLHLDMYGIATSSGSACTSGTLDPSHVLLAIGIPVEFAHGSLRFTFSRDNDESDVDRVIEVLPGIVGNLRAMSPFKKEQ